MSFLVQFLRFRRGVPEVVRTLHFQIGNSEEALQAAKARMRAGGWPARTDALRVMDAGGRTLIDWLAPAAPLPPYVDTVSQAAQQRMAPRAVVPCRSSDILKLVDCPTENISKSDRLSPTRAMPDPTFGGEVLKSWADQGARTRADTGSGAPTKHRTAT